MPSYRSGEWLMRKWNKDRICLSFQCFKPRQLGRWKTRMYHMRYQTIVTTVTYRYTLTWEICNLSQNRNMEFLKFSFYKTPRYLFGTLIDTNGAPKIRIEIYGLVPTSPRKLTNFFELRVKNEKFQLSHWNGLVSGSRLPNLLTFSQLNQLVSFL